MATRQGYWQAAIAFIPIGLLGFATSGAFAQGVERFETPEYDLGWQLGAVNAAEAYSMGYTGRGVAVGVHDSGLDTRHWEFDGRVLDGYDFTFDREITGKANFETDTHGTHVSGIIAADRDGRGMHGVAFDAGLMPVIMDLNTQDEDAVFTDSWRFLADQGVSIINNSIGVNDCALVINPPCNVTDYAPGELAARIPDTIAAMKYTAQKDVLMVFATGNEAQPAPDALGGMPHWIPELRDNWLVVGAVDSNRDLASFSNRCGVAAEWCLVAPGVDVLSTMPLGAGAFFDPNYERQDGTSMATPVVSGVAALVKEAFPFFSARDLQQTLLTTATDLGNRDLYGWGMVNAARAVRGYGSFVSDVVVNTQGYDATFGNDIDGVGSLTKAGDGMLSLAGDNSYTGGTFVRDGGVSIDGSVSSLVVVDLDGTVRGTGTIAAPLTVAGRLAPGNSPGTLTVNGPVTLLDSSVSQFDIDGTGTGTGAGNHSRLVTTGDAGVVTLAGALAPVTRGIAGDATNSYVAPLGTRFAIIQSSAGVEGGFASLTQPDAAGLAPATRFDTLYGSADVSIVATPAAYGDLAANGLRTTGNADAAGAALDEIRPVAGPRTSPLFSGLYATGPTALPNALGQLSGEVHASARVLHVMHANATQDAISDRIRMAFSHGDSTDRATFWSSANGSLGSVEGGDASTFDWEMANSLFGLDAPLGDFSRVGLAGGFGHSEGDTASYGASAKATHYDLAAYAARAFGPFNASIGASYTWSDVSTRRSPAFGTFTETLTASYDTETAQVFGEVGYEADFDALVVNPFVSGAFMTLNEDRFEEAGGSAALSGTLKSQDLGLSVVGTRLSTDFDLGPGKLSTGIMVGWQHRYGDVKGAADVRFAGGTAFMIDGTALARDAARLDVGVDYAFDEKVKVGLGYRGVFADTSNASSLKGYLNIAF